MPPKLTFWNNAGIKNNTVLDKKTNSEWFVSNLTSQMEVLYVNMVPRTQDEANVDFSMKFIQMTYIQSHLLLHPEGNMIYYFLGISIVTGLTFCCIGMVYLKWRKVKDISDDYN